MYGLGLLRLRPVGAAGTDAPEIPPAGGSGCKCGPFACGFNTCAPQIKKSDGVGRAGSGSSGVKRPQEARPRR